MENPGSTYPHPPTPVCSNMKLFIHNPVILITKKRIAALAGRRKRGLPHHATSINNNFRNFIQNLLFIFILNHTCLSVGKKKFLFGDKATEFDCSLFGSLSQILWQAPGSPQRHYIKGACFNITSYVVKLVHKTTILCGTIEPILYCQDAIQLNSLKLNYKGKTRKNQLSIEDDGIHCCVHTLELLHSI